MKRLLGNALLATVALVGSTGAMMAQDEGPIRIGALSSLSGAGAAIGTMTRAGYEFAVAEINARGGINGRPVELVVADTQSDPTHASSEARRLIENEGVVAIVGPATSQESIPVVEITTSFKIAQITTAASTALTPEVGPYHFSTSPQGAAQALPNLDYAIDTLGAQKIALISDNGGMAKSGIADLVEIMKSRGVEPVEVQEFAFKSEDITPQLFSMRRAEADAVILLNSLYDDSARLLQNREDIGWDVPTLVTLATVSNSATIAANIGTEAFRGVAGTQFVGITYCEGDELGASDYADYYTRATRDVPNIAKIGGPASVAYFYLAPIILAQAMEATGSTDGETVAGWIEDQDHIDTIIGPISATSDNHFLPGADSMVVVKTPYEVREDGTYLRIDCAD